ncbi:IMPACT family member YigZ [Hydrogenovibrio crunogenus]|uniref:IMPACT family member YigZ n=1 Tax=Hydrogenovibrio crunogenus TaxID=39765 RepID=A0A4P7P260_9GAMM|nr:YigZ family protein [Hydrogenovibrio crunogenus]QBZ84260.1 IMPACT family member YigZ [Hydrogenovibrio crunogenus]RUM92521.1 MAG: YigZ family protein [Thiomicrospira sp.]
MSYFTPTELAQAEIEIKKSRFLAFAKGIQSRAEGMEWLEDMKAAYPDARHHCWAYILGDPACATNAGMGDDGEPSGTAGKPILNVLQHKGVGDVMVIVVRYFGGIKLGAGGLTRAYSQSAQAVMEMLPTHKQIPLTSVKIDCDFSQEQPIRHLLSTLDGQVESIDYGQQVVIEACLPVSHLASFKDSLNAMGCPFKCL